MVSLRDGSQLAAGSADSLVQDRSGT